MRCCAGIRGRTSPNQTITTITTITTIATLYPFHAQLLQCFLMCKSHIIKCGLFSWDTCNWVIAQVTRNHLVLDLICPNWPVVEQMVHNVLFCGSIQPRHFVLILSFLVTDGFQPKLSFAGGSFYRHGHSLIISREGLNLTLSILPCLQGRIC